MKNSYRMFNIFGIDINVHITFILLPAVFYFIYGPDNGPRAVALVLLVFMFVTIHELCHSLMAKRFGIKVSDITLLPIGGIANMKSIPEKPRQELMISVVGPLSNIAIALILFVPLYLLIGKEALFSPGLGSWPQVIAYVFWINPALALFNLLPAFPMDGGRILRSILAGRMDYLRATQIATWFGHLFAIIFAIVGVSARPINFVLVIIGVFIYISASQELSQVDVRITLKRFKVLDILTEHFISISPDNTLQDVLKLVFHHSQEDFPVVEGVKLVGMLTRTDLINGMHHLGAQALVGDAMRTQFPSANARDSLIKANLIMHTGNIKALPVLKDGKLAGVVTVDDISKVYAIMSARHGVSG